MAFPIQENLTKETIAYAHKDFQSVTTQLRKPLEMYIRIACNQKNLSQEAIGLAHSDCQTGEAKPRKPSDMQIRIANLEKLKPGSHRICTCGLPI